MPTIIDSLVVTLGLDSSKFTKGQQDAVKSLRDLEKVSGNESQQFAKNQQKKEESIRKVDEAQRKSFKQLEENGKKAAQQFSNFKNELLAIGALLTGGMGLKNFITDTIVQTASLGRLSKNLDMSALSLSEWQHAAVMAGGTAEGVTSALQKAQNMQTEMRVTGKVSDELLQTQNYGSKYGFRLNANISAEQLLMQQADILKHIKDEQGVGAAKNIAGKMGIDENLFNLMQEGSDALRKNLDAQKDVAEQESKLAKSADDLRKETIALQNQFKAIGIELLNGALPAIREFTGFLGSPETKEALHTLVDGLKVTAHWISEFGKALGWLIAKITGNTPEVAPVDGAAPSASYSDLKKLSDRRKAAMAASRGASGSSSSNAVIGKLVAMGWTTEQAAGIAGSLQQESGLNASAMNPDSKMYGIAQWDTNRRNDFRSWSGHDIQGSTLDEQLAFMNYELTQGKERAAGDKIRASKTAADAAMAHSTYYERASKVGKWGANDDARVKNASNFLSSYNASNATGTSNIPLAFKNGGSATTNNSQSSQEVNIQNIHVNTQATDSQGIATSIGQSLNNHLFLGVPNANQGLS